MRMSKRLTAGAMGITTQTLLRLCRRYNIKFVPQSEMVEQCKAKGKGWPKGKSREGKVKYTNGYLLGLRITGETSRSFENRTSIAATTVSRRFGGWTKFMNYKEADYVNR